MLSLIATSYRGFDALKSLFTISDSEAELIIIDSNYSNEKKQMLTGLQHQYAQVIYAPVMPLAPPRKYDMMRALNTGYALAAGDYWIRIDDYMEFKPDYFDRVREAIQDCKGGKGAFIRAVELEESNGDVRWKSFIPDEGQRYIKLPCKPLGKPIPIMTLGTAVCPKQAILDINGIDERYDEGLGWNDNDMFSRSMVAGYVVYLDTKQMIFRHHHQSSGVGDPRMINQRFFFDVALPELNRGEYKTKNPFSIETLNKDIHETRKEYVL